MMRLIFLGLSVGLAARAATGIAIGPVVGQGGTVIARPGDRVEYSQDGGWITVGGIKGRLAWSNVIPIDETTTARILTELTATTAAENQEALRSRIDLADAALHMFPQADLREEIEAWAVRLESRLGCQPQTKAQGADTLTRAKAYLAQYPSGRYRDEFEWRAAVLSNAVYETEGHAEYPLRQARAYEKFLTEHPHTPFGEEIVEAEADAYRLAADFLDYGPDATKAGPGVAYRKKAEALYGSLMEASEIERAARARVALFDIRHDRRLF